MMMEIKQNGSLDTRDTVQLRGCVLFTVTQTIFVFVKGSLSYLKRGIPSTSSTPTSFLSHFARQGLTLSLFYNHTCRKPHYNNRVERRLPPPQQLPPPLPQNKETFSWRMS